MRTRDVVLRRRIMDGHGESRAASTPDWWKAAMRQRLRGRDARNGRAALKARQWNSQRSAEMTASVLERWADCVVTAGREPAPDIVHEFEQVLADTVDERPFAEFARVSHPCFSRRGLAPPGGSYWCLDRPHLGAEFVSRLFFLRAPHRPDSDGSRLSWRARP